MANTYEAIATVTVGSGGAANIQFTSIPQTYTDLLIKASLRTDRTAAITDGLLLQFNGSATSYSDRYLQGDGVTAYSGSNAFGTTRTYLGEMDTNGATSNTFSNQEVYIPNYAGNTNKSLSADSVMENNATTAYPTLTANLWSNTSAITSIKLYFVNSSNFVQYSTATLYGIKNS